MIYRVSKERATSHHVINQAANLLKPNALLILAGEKNDGLKSYVKQASRLFCNSVNAEKNGKSYIASIALKTVAAEPLNDKDYSQLRPIQLNDNITAIEAGDFGWDKMIRQCFLIDYHHSF